jgi:hypothetical protein
VIGDPAFAPSIERLLTHPDADWRREGLSALRNMRIPEAIRLFIAGLSDADLLNQNICVLALAETTGQYDDRAPSWPLFKENPSYYVDKWRDWWETEGKALYGSPAAGQ